MTCLFLCLKFEVYTKISVGLGSYKGRKVDSSNLAPATNVIIRGVS